MLTIAGGILLAVFVLFVVLPLVTWVTVCLFLTIQYHRHKNDPTVQGSIEIDRRVAAP
jgi:hypothetical protein